MLEGIYLWRIFLYVFLTTLGTHEIHFQKINSQLCEDLKVQLVVSVKVWGFINVNINVQKNKYTNIQLAKSHSWKATNSWGLLSFIYKRGIKLCPETLIAISRVIRSGKKLILKQCLLSNSGVFLSPPWLRATIINIQIKKAFNSYELHHGALMKEKHCWLLWDQDFKTVHLSG